MRTGFVLAIAVVALLSCQTRPSKVHGAPKAAPDEQFEIGSTDADRFLVWNCYEGERVAMIQGCVPHSCAGWHVYRGPCGTATTAETEAFRTLAARGDIERHAIPEGSGWR
jgi:hypothetical protein